MSGFNPNFKENKYYCTICNIWVDNNKRSILSHNQGRTHLEKSSKNVSEKLRSISSTFQPGVPKRGSQQQQSSTAAPQSGQVKTTAPTQPSTSSSRGVGVGLPDGAPSTATASTSMGQEFDAQLWLTYIRNLPPNDYTLYEEQCAQSGIVLADFLTLLQDTINAQHGVDVHTANDQQQHHADGTGAGQQQSSKKRALASTAATGKQVAAAATENEWEDVTEQAKEQEAQALALEIPGLDTTTGTGGRPPRSLRPAEHDIIPLSVLASGNSGAASGAAGGSSTTNMYFANITSNAGGTAAEHDQVAEVKFKRKRKRVKDEPS